MTNGVGWTRNFTNERRATRLFYDHYLLTVFISALCIFLSTAESAKAKASKPSTGTSTPTSNTAPNKTKPKTALASKNATASGSKPVTKKAPSGLASDVAALGISDESATVSRDDTPVPAMSMKRAELIEKIHKEEEAGKKGVSLVVVGKSHTIACLCLPEFDESVFRSCRCRKIDSHGTVAL
jgi:hypothetical protein